MSYKSAELMHSKTGLRVVMFDDVPVKTVFDDLTIQVFFNGRANAVFHKATQGFTILTRQGFSTLCIQLETEINYGNENAIFN